MCTEVGEPLFDHLPQMIKTSVRTYFILILSTYQLTLQILKHIIQEWLLIENLSLLHLYSVGIHL